MNNIKAGNIICSIDNNLAYVINEVNLAGITVNLPGFPSAPFHVSHEDLKRDYDNGHFKIFVPEVKSVKRYVVTAVDHDINGNCDGKARVLGMFKTREEAKNYVDEDIREWIDKRADEGCECDFDKMSAWYDYHDSDRCEWNIEEVEIEL